ncbi:hemolysin III, putative [Entamoeba dispar SAW760]|uniref:Hemolysin III, putative n=1 Tax=Entamoeba dispar (strain ATCC PRA-260 / SAW760) TaxID=370354 RepID=B0E735_ENTDS|nr:hemolysin III, putative [Entamoeba dispar SAW760]EDR29646.1 hemolysin III, putative [Entamoeba dispar SAW760]|eukprot:EDR29646.1 hemolysin III, putative [Entamoeba dispar SAW760]
MCILCDFQFYYKQLHPEDERKQTSIEECFNCLTHIIGIIFSLFQLKSMWRLCMKKQLGEIKKASVISFCISSLTLYSNSTIYHLFNLITPQMIVVRYIFQRLDHMTIYIMILGCYVSFILSRLFDKKYFKIGVIALFLIGMIAITGLIITVFVTPSSGIGVILYLSMGFSCLLVAPGWFYFCPISLLLWLLTGGVTYYLGTIFFLWDKLVCYFMIP